ncbi:MAG: hypothetical protein ACOX7P_10045 [Oscillospiraceae bacterium]
MPYCANCGTQYEVGAKYCPTCGVALNPAENPGPQQQTSNAADSINQAAEKVGSAIGKITDTPDHTGEYPQDDIAQNKVFAIFAYLSILVLIPIFAAPNSKFAKFHANNGLVLFIIEIIVWFVFFLIKLPFQVTFWGGYGVGYIIVSVIQWIISIPILVLAIMGIVYAATGKAKDLPLISSIKILK